MKQVPRILKNPLFILSIIVWLYVLIPFLAPFAYVTGMENIGWSINQIYENFCHQRVERSIFLFSEDSPIRFYSVKELKDQNYLPPTSESDQWPEYFGHDYVGNDVVGYKVPLCIRDIALYGAYAVTLLIFALMRRSAVTKVISVKKLYLFAFLLTLPMVIDGIAQSVVEVLTITSVPMSFVNSISKRIITGILFGVGAGLITLKMFNTSSLTKAEEKGKIEV
ncbi:DUF2085 domain-containing protein [Candidatus Dojkabacteria bacterium]|nr:DUF2085 domain-containing protein [Candidatus Dojkabacteria bacterium]